MPNLCLRATQTHTPKTVKQSKPANYKLFTEERQPMVQQRCSLQGKYLRSEMKFRLKLSQSNMEQRMLGIKF